MSIGVMDRCFWIVARDKKTEAPKGLGDSVMGRRFLGLLRRFVLGELRGRELTGLNVAFIQFRVMLPLFGQVIQRENR